MKLSEVKNTLNNLQEVSFELSDGNKVPAHFHVTEVGKIHKHFIDCGGTVRDEVVVNFQLWSANDTEHRLSAEKLLKIINLSENVLGIQDHEVEVEYQSDTIGKYALDYNGSSFVLSNKHTDCLASDSCGITSEKKKVKLATLGESNEASCCTPGGGCC
ncbi:MAG: DUF6428 family protein [Bacteroidia bacterium]